MHLTTIFWQLGLSSKRSRELARRTPRALARMFEQKVEQNIELRVRLSQGNRKGKAVAALSIPTRAPKDDLEGAKNSTQDEKLDRSILIEFLTTVFRDTQIPMKTQIAILHRFFHSFPHKESHSILGELWRVGLSERQFDELCSLCLENAMPRWRAAIKLGISKEISSGMSQSDKAKARNLAAKNLQRHLNNTIFFWEHEVEPRGRKGGNICIPLIYFPSKSEAEVAKLRELKKRKFALELFEEPIVHRSSSIQRSRHVRTRS